MTKTIVKFKKNHLPELRQQLLRDTSKEWFGMALGNLEKVGSTYVITVKRVKVFTENECEMQSITHVRPSKDAILKELIIAQKHFYDCVLDLHTHPFATGYTRFSSTDTSDERTFSAYLRKTVGTLDNYGSIVFSREMYSGRMWLIGNKQLKTPKPLEIMVPMPCEAIAPCDQLPWKRKDLVDANFFTEKGFLSRNYQMFGKEMMERIVQDQKLVIIGAGSISSIFVDAAVRSGFRNFTLVDFDTVEHSNLSRLVGATYADAERKAKKVAVLKKHLLKIHPKTTVKTYDANILNPPAGLLEEIATAQWVVIGTDNASSRFASIKYALQFHTPYISMGVHVSVHDGAITDVSGEVITVRPGDNLCHLCLGRVDHMQIAHESNPDEHIREELLKRGYVTGAHVSNPMVMTVNEIVASMAFDTLCNQYNTRQKHHAISVYENNEAGPTIYPDEDSVIFRKRGCALCHS